MYIWFVCLGWSTPFIRYALQISWQHKFLFLDVFFFLPTRTSNTSPVQIPLELPCGFILKEVQRMVNRSDITKNLGSIPQRTMQTRVHISTQCHQRTGMTPKFEECLPFLSQTWRNSGCIPLTLHEIYSSTLKFLM